MAIFTKRHYLHVAKYLRDIKSEQLRIDIATELAVMFDKDNPLFDESRFLKDAGLENYMVGLVT